MQFLLFLSVSSNVNVHPTAWQCGDATRQPQKTQRCGPTVGYLDYDETRDGHARVIDANQQHQS